uniref:Uncharacterized protein n=1 Tax=Arundo donax TaxID=35708 RepID=A0A0A9AVY6_ARUDO
MPVSLCSVSMYASVLTTQRHKAAGNVGLLFQGFLIHYTIYSQPWSALHNLSPAPSCQPLVVACL